MNKPNNYDNVTVGGDFTPIELGGHHLCIVGLDERKSSSGADMIVVAFDFASDDVQAGYFKKAFASDERPDKKWPNSGTKYILVLDSRSGETSRSFKSFITSVEHSNPGFATNWCDDFGKQFTGKKVGAVFGEVENEYNGKVTMRHELRWFCDDNKVNEQNVPEPKYIEGKRSNKPANSNFMDVSGEEVPF